MYPNQAKKQNAFSDPTSSLGYPVSFPFLPWIPKSSSLSPSPPPQQAGSHPPSPQGQFSLGHRWPLVCYQMQWIFFFFKTQPWSASEPAARGHVWTQTPHGSFSVAAGPWPKCLPFLSLSVTLCSHFISGLCSSHFNQNQLHSFQGAWQRKMRGPLFKRINSSR